MVGHRDGPYVRAQLPPLRTLQPLAACPISPTFPKLFFLITQPLRTTHILFAATDALLPQFSFSR